MAEKLQITIVGLGLIGSSAGLALRRYADKVSIVGHDKDSKRTAKAKKVSAVDRTEWNLISAVSEADRVLLALPAAWKLIDKILTEAENYRKLHSPTGGI